MRTAANDPFVACRRLTCTHMVMSNKLTLLLRLGYMPITSSSTFCLARIRHYMNSMYKGKFHHWEVNILTIIRSWTSEHSWIKTVPERINVIRGQDKLRQLSSIHVIVFRSCLPWWSLSTSIKPITKPQTMLTVHVFVISIQNVEQ